MEQRWEYISRSHQPLILTFVFKAKTRWIVPSLQKDIRALKEAREKRSAAIKTFKYRLYDEFDADRAVWLRTVRVFAELDCLLSLAKSSIAIGEPSCRPVFAEGDAAFLEFKNLRHPNIASLKDFIPNTVHLGGKAGRIALLTGELPLLQYRRCVLIIRS